ncbi:MAG TPA: beta-N-acetylhexosaminidase [Verrucomicrobiae bacterium]
MNQTGIKPMRLRVIFWLAIIIALPQISALPIDASQNHAPATVPSLRAWAGDEGEFTFSRNAPIIVDRKYHNQLVETASLLKNDLKQITGDDHRVVLKSKPKAGDLFLTLDNSDRDIGDEGYLLQVGKAATIRANTDTGVFYGTQTLLQIIALDAAHSTIPRGTACDSPLCGYRGQMIDVGRRYYQMNYLENQIREMAWYKMNMLHLHFTDWDGFRLVSKTYPGLATSPAYSKEDIRQLQDVAKRYHITIVPEIDLPAHAKAMTDYDPKLRFTCDSMDTGHWAGSKNGGWMLDITRPEVRAWIKSLLDEFIPEFDGPYFHIGCDEWEFENKQWQCPELVDYMKKKGYAKPTDVFVEWINEVDAQVRSYGKTMQLWNWWDYKQSPDLQPNKDIIINVWTAAPDHFTTNGWKVIDSPEDGPDALYVSPGDGGTSLGQYGYVDSKRIYELWNMPSDPKLMGFQLCRWSDNVESESDAWLDNWARRPLQVLAERVWGGPRSTTVTAFYSRVDALGNPPEPLTSVSK